MINDSFKSVGKLEYFNSDYKLLVNVDPDIAKYYLKMIPRWVAEPKHQRHSTHITVIRNEKPLYLEHWEKYKDKEIEFTYSPYVYTDNVYFWLNTFSTELELIRIELGLPISSEWSRPPNNAPCFHITIGNMKTL